MNHRDIFKFTLYVAGGTQNSAQALSNLNALCREYLPHRHIIEIVDVLRESKRALADGVFLTPALLKVAPAPFCKIVGTLSNTGPILRALGLESLAT